jgi:hypothetical protein
VFLSKSPILYNFSNLTPPRTLNTGPKIWLKRLLEKTTHKMSKDLSAFLSRDLNKNQKNDFFNRPLLRDKKCQKIDD